MAISTTISPFFLGIAIQNGLFPTEGLSLPHIGMQLSVLIQLIAMNPSFAIFHA